MVYETTTAKAKDHWLDCSFVTHFSCPDEFVSRSSEVKLLLAAVQDQEEEERLGRKMVNHPPSRC